jgi:hypothetical protein
MYNMWSHAFVHPTHFLYAPFVTHTYSDTHDPHGHLPACVRVCMASAPPLPGRARQTAAYSCVTGDALVCASAARAHARARQACGDIQSLCCEGTHPWILCTDVFPGQHSEGIAGVLACNGDA